MNDRQILLTVMAVTFAITLWAAVFTVGLHFIFKYW